MTFKARHEFEITKTRSFIGRVFLVKIVNHDENE
jgi:hypothetical protein